MKYLKYCALPFILLSLAATADTFTNNSDCTAKGRRIVESYMCTKIPCSQDKPIQSLDDANSLFSMVNEVCNGTKTAKDCEDKLQKMGKRFTSTRDDFCKRLLMSYTQRR